MGHSIAKKQPARGGRGGAEELALIAPSSVADLDEVALMTALCSNGDREVVNKRGPDGAWALAGDALIESPGHPVDVIDTVGAGDAFVAGYLSARLEGLNLAARLARANACGALVCMTPGDWEGAARSHDLHRFENRGADPVSR